MPATPAELRGQPSPADGDWVWAQAQWELGLLAPAVIARAINRGHMALIGMASRRGWVRDPDAKTKITAAAEAKIAAKRTELVEAQKAKVVQVTAVMQSQVLVQHREDIARARRIASMMLDELEQTILHVEELEDLGDLLRSPDERNRDKLNDRYRRIISMPDRSASLTSLANALKTIVLLERQAYSIAGLIEDPEQTRPPEEVTKGLDKIMSKFDEVLALQVPRELAAESPGRATPLAERVDVPSPSRTEAPVSPV